jgi:hypothetical protein
MTGMTQADRAALIHIAKARARLAKAAVVEREKILLNEIEEHMTAEFRLRDEVHADVVAMAEEALAKVNEQIRNQARLMGYDARNVPQAGLPYSSPYDRRSDQDKDEARKRADTRLAALHAAAYKAIEEATLHIEESIIVGGLESAEAKALVDTLPPAEQLMPPLSLADLGVRTWQPSRDAAKELLAAPTGANRRRTLIMRAIAANPQASDREIGRIAGFDHKTVAKYRTEEIQAIGGESGRPAGEIPTGEAES